MNVHFSYKLLLLPNHSFQFSSFSFTGTHFMLMCAYVCVRINTYSISYGTFSFPLSQYETFQNTSTVLADQNRLNTLVISAIWLTELNNFYKFDCYSSFLLSAYAICRNLLVIVVVVAVVVITFSNMTDEKNHPFWTAYAFRNWL